MEAQAPLKCLQMTPISAWVQFDIVQSNQSNGDERNLEINKWFKPEGKKLWKNIKTSEKQLTKVPACYVKIRLMSQLTTAITVWKDLYCSIFEKSSKHLGQMSIKGPWKRQPDTALTITVGWLDCFSKRENITFRKCSSYVVMSPRARIWSLFSDYCSYVNKNCTQTDREEELLQRVFASKRIFLTNL